MEIDKLERLKRLQKDHSIIQGHIYELEDLIRANERNLGREKFKEADRVRKIIKSYKAKRTENNLERWNLVYGSIN